MDICCVEDCKNQKFCKTFCVKHYHRWRRYGDPHFVKARRWEPANGDGTKVCFKCDRRLPLDAFEKRKNSKDGLRNSCKECRNTAWKKRYAEDENFRSKKLEDAKNLKIKNPEAYRRQSRNATLRAQYGIDIDEYDKMFQEQGGVCAICRNSAPEGKHFSIDHDHVSQKVRKLLCNGCNTGLGFFNDSPMLLDAAADYLRKHQSS